MQSVNGKAVVRLIAGPADGLVFSVPGDEIPLFVAFGSVPVARYERVPGNGEVICYQFRSEDSRQRP